MSKCLQVLVGILGFDFGCIGLIKEELMMRIVNSIMLQYFTLCTYSLSLNILQVGYWGEKVTVLFIKGLDIQELFCG